MKYSYLLLLATCFIACEKQEGQGGKREISGVVSQVLIAPDGSVSETRPASDQDVYIVYGDLDGYQDDVKSTSDGSYRFPYLRQGHYSVFSFSDCDTCPSGMNEITNTVELSNDDIISNLEIKKMVDYDDGSSNVSGTLLKQQYLGPSTFGDPYQAQEEEVYIRYGSEEVYFDRMDTGSDGGYEFKNLIQGTYTIYAFSECSTCVDTMEIVQQEIVVDQNGTTYTLNDITVQVQN